MIRSLILILTVTGFSHAHAQGEVASQINAYAEHFSDLNRAFNRSVSTLRTLYQERETRAQELGRLTPYTVKSGQKSFELHELDMKIQRNVQSANALQSKSMEAFRRFDVAYRKASESTAKPIKLMRDLSPTARAFVEARQRTSTALEWENYTDFQRGRDMGETYKGPAQGSRFGPVKVKLNGSTQEILDLERGQGLLVRSVAGDMIKGRVMAIEPDGKVVIQRELPDGIASETSALRRLDLNRMAEVDVFANTGSIKPPEPFWKTGDEAFLGVKPVDSPGAPGALQTARLRPLNKAFLEMVERGPSTAVPMSSGGGVSRRIPITVSGIR